MKMLSRRQTQQRADFVLDALKKRYPVAKTMLVHATPWQLLVATVLSAQCTDARVNGITPEFFRRWPDPAQLAGQTPKDVEDVIRSAGFYHAKAKNLLAAARFVLENCDGEVPCSIEQLVRIPGVARKTANVVLWGAFGINQGIAVDTHVKRISFRLGLTINTDPVKIERDLVGLFPQEEWGNVNHRLVMFGRDVCSARNPGCGRCEMLCCCPRNGVKER